MAETLKTGIPGLKSQETEAVLAFLRRLGEAYQSQIGDVRLYGSKARGDSTPESDVDILVLMKSDDRALRRSILQLAARVSLEHDVILSLMVMSEARWEDHRGLSLHANIIRDSRQLAFLRN